MPKLPEMHHLKLYGKLLQIIFLLILHGPYNSAALLHFLWQVTRDEGKFMHAFIHSFIHSFITHNVQHIKFSAVAQYKPGPKFTDDLKTILRQFSDLW